MVRCCGRGLEQVWDPALRSTGCGGMPAGSPRRAPFHVECGFARCAAAVASSMPIHLAGSTCEGPRGGGLLAAALCGAGSV